MSVLCGGKTSIWKDIYYLIKYAFQEEKMSCPRCGKQPFRHGTSCVPETYCTHCHLWEPDWEQMQKDIEEAMAQNEKIT